MNRKYPHFAIPEIYGESLSYYELLRKLVESMNVVIENYDTIPDQIAEAVKDLDASQLFSAVLEQIIDSIATDNTKSANAVKVYKKHDLLYATFNDTVNLYESLIDFSTGTATELIPGTNIREVNISELFIELRKLIDINKNKNTEQDNEISTLRTMISSPYNFKGDVASLSALPASGEVNDTYYVQDVKYKVTWTGSAWVQSSLNEADYQTELSEIKGDLVEYNKVTNALKTTEITEGAIINHVDGSIISNEYSTNYAVTDFIKINMYDRVYLAFVRGFSLCGGALYDSNKNYIKTIWGTDDWKKPSTDSNKPFSFVVDSDDIKYIRYNIVEPKLFSRGKQYLKVQKLYNIKGFVDDVIKNYVGPILYVSTTRTGSNVFTKLKDCTEYISNNNIQNAIVYVDAETFDLVNEYGQEYLDSIQSTTNKGFGLHVGNNTHFIFAEGSKVVFHYKGTNSYCAEFFSPFNVTGSVTIENANIEVSNARYCVHEDLPTSSNTIPDNTIVKYINCVMNHKGDTIPSGSHSGYACIGGGTNKNTLSILKGGKYKSVWQAPVSYHNYYGSLPSKVILENVWMDKALRLADFGTNEVEVQITGCYIPNGIIGTHTYFTITEWNNSFSS